ncbi:hypothetical protein BDC45DRAFT_314785 [Circinella umbellata]|nr:hypothetical protein BDC45DRAFT_314785 [Circinella umbellata]
MSHEPQITDDAPNVPTTSITASQTQQRRLVGVLTSVHIKTIPTEKCQSKRLGNILKLYHRANERLDLMQEEIKELRQLVQKHCRRSKRTIPPSSSSNNSSASESSLDNDESDKVKKGEVLPPPEHVATQLDTNVDESNNNDPSNKSPSNPSSNSSNKEGYSDHGDSDDDDCDNETNIREEDHGRWKKSRKRPVPTTPKKRGRPSKKVKEQEQQLKDTTIATSSRSLYALNRDITSVLDIWREYTVGLSRREPPVKYLTYLHVTEFFINEREPIITEIIKIMEEKKKSELDAVRLLDSHRLTLNIDLKNLAKRIKVHRLIDEERGLTPSTFI